MRTTVSLFRVAATALPGLVLLSGCEQAWINSIASLGGDVPGGRGNLGVIFDNNTPYRAIFTFGVYDPQDQTSVPQYGQFAVDPDEAETPFNRGLAPNTVTDLGTFSVLCGRTFSLGGQGLIDRINDQKDLLPVYGAPVVQDVLRAGISFTDLPLDDPNINTEFTIEAPAVDSLLGIDYVCDSLLIYTFEVDPQQADHILVTLEVIEEQEQ